MKSYFNDKITSLEEAHEFLTKLSKDGLLFHPEDDPSTVTDRSGNDLFSYGDVLELRKRIAEVYSFDHDPCKFCLSLETPPNPAPGSDVVEVQLPEDKRPEAKKLGVTYLNSKKRPVLVQAGAEHASRFYIGELLMAVNCGYFGEVAAGQTYRLEGHGVFVLAVAELPLNLTVPVWMDQKALPYPYEPDPVLTKQILKKIDELERLCDGIGHTPVRHAVSEHIVRARLYVRDGNLAKLNGGK